MCRSGAPSGAQLVTFGSCVRCVEVKRRSAVLCADECSPKRADEMNVLGLGGEQLEMNVLSQPAALSEIEANC